MGTTTQNGSARSAAPGLARARACGFTMIELLITMTVAVILLMIAIPAFQYVTNANRISAEVNGLVGDLEFARAEAVKEGQTVSVCASSDGATCSGSNSWQSGWIVFVGSATPVPAGSILRVQSQFTSTDTFVASNAVSLISFNRNGYAVGLPAGTLIALHDVTSNKNWTRCSYINQSGQITTEQYGNVTNGVECT